MRYYLLVLAACSSTPAPSAPNPTPTQSASKDEKVFEGDATILTEQDMARFESYTRITGFVVIYNTKLTTLKLPKLTSIGGDLQISFNNALSDLDGLPALASVGGALLIGSNSALRNVDGLSKLTTVSGRAIIAGNGSLTSVDGLSSLTSVGGDLAISSNRKLPSGTAEAVANRARVSGKVKIGQNGYYAGEPPPVDAPAAKACEQQLKSAPIESRSARDVLALSKCFWDAGSLGAAILVHRSAAREIRGSDDAILLLAKRLEWISQFENRYAPDAARQYEDLARRQGPNRGSPALDDDYEARGVCMWEKSGDADAAARVFQRWRSSPTRASMGINSPAELCSKLRPLLRPE